MFVTAPELNPVSTAIKSLGLPCNHCCMTADLIFSGSLVGNSDYCIYNRYLMFRQIRQIGRQIRQNNSLQVWMSIPT